MNKERELLRQALDYIDRNYDRGLQLYKEIEVFLSNPSDDAEEPVAWRYKGESWFDGEDWNEQFHIVTHESIAKNRDRNCRPLYLHPPKPAEPAARKPMTEEEIWSAYRTSEDRETFFDGIRYAEKHHKIGDNRE